jgi:hypothetical protein
LGRALALWRGPALADVMYEPFAQAEAARLEELRLGCVEARVEADLARGRHAELIGELEALIDQHGDRERLRGQLMVALYRSGRQAEALEVYRRTRQHLVDELGLEPGPDLRSLETAILNHDPRLTWTPPSTATPKVRRADRIFVGRERELAQLLAAADELHRGRGSLFLLRGEPGIGKTWLAEEAAARAAERGALVLSGRCWESGGAPAYWPWVQCLRKLVQETEPETLAAQLGVGAVDVVLGLHGGRLIAADGLVVRARAHCAGSGSNASLCHRPISYARPFSHPGDDMTELTGPLVRQRPYCAHTARGAKRRQNPTGNDHSASQSAAGKTPANRVWERCRETVTAPARISLRVKCSTS